MVEASRYGEVESAVGIDASLALKEGQLQTQTFFPNCSDHGGMRVMHYLPIEVSTAGRYMTLPAKLIVASKT